GTPSAGHVSARRHVCDREVAVVIYAAAVRNSKSTRRLTIGGHVHHTGPRGATVRVQNGSADSCRPNQQDVEVNVGGFAAKRDGDRPRLVDRWNARVKGWSVTDWLRVVTENARAATSTATREG